MAQPLPRTLQPPPELPGDSTISDKLSQYLRTFSLWCRHGFADKLSISGAAPRVLLQANDTTPPTPGPVYQLEVTSAPTLTLKQVSFGDGSLGPPITLTVATDLNAYLKKAGVTDGSNAPAGQIGEFITASSGTVSLTTGVYANVTSIVLTPGDWDVSARLYLASTAGASNFQGGFTTTSGGAAQDIIFAGSAVVGTFLTTVPTTRFNVTVSTRVYLVGFIVFASGTATTEGDMQARRMR